LYHYKGFFATEPIIEQDHRSADKTLKGIEAINMIKKGQINDLNYSVLNEIKYINQLFGIVL
jgi:hypothetical protein